jgi:hypothetical protein
MRLRSLTTFAVAVAATFIAYGCAGDSPVAPKAPAAPTIAPADSASNSLLGGLLGGGTTSTTTINPLLRTKPLASDIVVSKTIGALGGTLSIPGAGLTVVVPPLAILKNTAFKVTARKGSYIAYDFEPHGTKFLLPLVMTQSLVNTQASSLLNLNLSLGYYPDPTKITSVTELLGVQVDQLKLTSVSTIWHFSGYIVATGRSAEE